MHTTITGMNIKKIENQFYFHKLFYMGMILNNGMTKLEDLRACLKCHTVFAKGTTIICPKCREKILIEQIDAF
jgi:uncharacterized paraquat-inducible protein A